MIYQPSRALVARRYDKGIVFKASADFENQTGDAIQTWYKTFSAYNRGTYCPSLTITYLTGSGGSAFLSSAVALTENIPETVSLAYLGEQRYFSFKPASTGFYTFYSYADEFLLTATGTSSITSSISITPSIHGAMSLI